MPDPSIDDIRKFEKKVYLFLLAGMVIGGILLALVWRIEGIVAGIVGIVGIIIIVLALIMMGFFFDSFYKIKGQVRANANMETFKVSHVKWPPWFTKYGRKVLLLLFAGIVYFFASRHENDFGGKKFVIHSVIAGIVAGLVVYNIVRLQKPKWNENPELGKEAGLYIVVGFACLFVAFSPAINQYYATAPADCKEYTLTNASAPFIYVEHNGKRERFKPGRPFAETAKGKKSVVLCVRKGYLGYDFVSSFALSDSSKTGLDNQK